MSAENMAFVDYLRKEELTEDIDFLREATEFMYQQLIDAEAEEVITEVHLMLKR